MMLKVQILRAIKVSSTQLRASLSLDNNSTNEQLESKLIEKFGPMAPRFKIFWSPATGYDWAVAGINVLNFDVQEAHVPQAGVMTADPLSKEQILLIDGALVSELERIGVYVDSRSVEWRCIYICNGN
jgi:hypothetical protein